MTTSLAITFESTHLTMKAHRVLKKVYNSEVIPAPKELSSKGCKIALLIDNASLKQQVLELLRQNQIQHLNIIELHSTA